MHLRILRQIAQVRRRQLQAARNERTADSRDGRLRGAEDARSRADAQLDAACPGKGP